MSFCAVFALYSLLLILPELLDAEDVQLLSVDVREEPVGLTHWLALWRPLAVPHQVHTSNHSHTHTHTHGHNHTNTHMCKCMFFVNR